jgi:uncharacterized protein YkwD
MHPSRSFRSGVAVIGAVLILAFWGCGGGGGTSGESGDPSVLGPGPEVRLVVTPTAGTAPLEVAFDASGSSAPEGGALTFAWDLGNGRTSSAPSGSLTYAVPGIYTVQVTVTGASGSASAQANVLVAAPAGEVSPADRVLYLTNLERRANGLPPVKGQPNLEAAAAAHAQDMAFLDYFAHDSADGRTPWDRLRAAGYDYSAAGENIAAGYATPEAAMEGWMSSPGHRANILNGTFRELGVGHFWEAGDAFPGPYGYGHYWVQDFGTRTEVFPVVIEDEAFETTDPTVGVYVYGSGWAEEMMLSEEPDFGGAVWVPFAPEAAWQLSPGAGLKTVCVRLRSGSSVRAACDEIWLR